MLEQDKLIAWDQEQSGKLENFIAHEAEELERVSSFSEISAQLANTTPRANDNFRRQLESQLMAIMAERINLTEEVTRPSWLQRLLQKCLPITNLNPLDNDRRTTLHPKLRLIAATLTLVIVLLFAVHPPMFGWAQDVSVRFINILGTGTMPTTVATALNGPSPTPSLTPTPTNTPLLSIQSPHAALTPPHHPGLTIHQPPPVPTPPSTQ